MDRSESSRGGRKVGGGQGNYCQTPEEMAIINAEGTPGGALYRAVNKVADGLKDEFPNVAVDTLAYQWGRPAPKITKVPLDA